MAATHAAAVPQFIAPLGLMQVWTPTLVPAPKGMLKRLLAGKLKSASQVMLFTVVDGDAVRAEDQRFGR
jgi:hypothetical protein